MNWLFRLNKYYDRIEEPYRFFIFLVVIAIPLGLSCGYGQTAVEDNELPYARDILYGTFAIAILLIFMRVIYFIQDKNIKAQEDSSNKDNIKWLP